MPDTLLDSDLLSCREVFRRGSYAEAAVLARAALNRAREAEDPVRVVQALSWLGGALALDGQYQTALDLLNQALEEAERTPTACPARALNYLAVIHEELGDFATAAGLYRRGIEAARRSGERDIEVILMANLADGQVSSGDAANALPLIDAAEAAALEIEDFSHVGWLRATRARVFEARGAFAAADAEFAEAVHFAARGFSQRLVAESLREQGAWMIRRGRQEEGLERLHEALALATELGVRREIYKTHEALSLAFEGVGDHARALHHHRAFFRVHSAVFDDVVRGKVAALRAEAELQRSQHARELERLRWEELRRALDTVEAQARRLEELTTRDDLTGLHNRRHANRRLDAAVARFAADRRIFALALVDADHFKRINDDFGHAAGDAVLNGLAAALRDAVGGEDLVARYGGEEFLLLFPGIDRSTAAARCESIRQRLRTHTWPLAGRALTISVGIADAREARGSDELLALADRRLYAAKAAGRDRVVHEH